MKKRVTVWAIKKDFGDRVEYTLHPGTGKHKLEELAVMASWDFRIDHASLVEIELREVHEMKFAKK